MKMILADSVRILKFYELISSPRFNCGGWLSRSEDDGSVERFLVGEKVPLTYRNSVNMAALGVDGVLPSPGNRRRALTSTRREGENGERERRERTVRRREW